MNRKSLRTKVLCVLLAGMLLGGSSVPTAQAASTANATAPPPVVVMRAPSDVIGEALGGGPEITQTPPEDVQFVDELHNSVELALLNAIEQLFAQVFTLINALITSLFPAVPTPTA
jgi:hypothetical protein